MVPGAVTTGGSAEAVCGQSLSGVDAAVLLVAILLEYTFRVWSVLHAQMEV